MEIAVHPEAATELAALPLAEYAAMQRAFEKLEQYGDQLGHPHSSQVKGAQHLRELRPRAGRSRWRAFYRRVGARMVIASIGPEARTNPSGFRYAMGIAEDRLGQLERLT